MSIRSKLFLSAIAAVVGAGAHASLIDTGTLVGVGGIDQAWTVQTTASNPGLIDPPNAYVAPQTNNFPFNYWGAPLPNSQWIVPTINGPSVSLDPTAPGFYTYTSNAFTLGANGGFSGNFLADNSVTQIYVTGSKVTYAYNNGPPIGGFGGTGTYFSFSGLDAGTYRLSFVVENFAQDGGNPSGLDVAFNPNSIHESVSGVPEPSTWAMMMLGFLSVGLLAYRRKPGFRMA